MIGSVGVERRVTRGDAFFIHLEPSTMDAQASTSSGAMDQRRKDALKNYRDVCSFPNFPVSS